MSKRILSIMLVMVLAFGVFLPAVSFAEKVTGEQVKVTVEETKEEAVTEEAKEVEEVKEEATTEEAKEVEEVKEETATEEAKEVEVFSASVSVQNVTLNGKEVKIAGYNIAGSNYFKLRDVAAILRETNDKFNVAYDDATRTINIEKGAEYALIDGDLKELAPEKQNATKSTQPVVIKGLETQPTIEAFFINGNNFFKIRDLGQALGFIVDYNEETNTVILTTTEVTEEVETTEEVKTETTEEVKEEVKVEEVKVEEVKVEEVKENK